MSTRKSRVAATPLAVLVAAGILATGCAYFNTFYTARKNYRDAERQMKDSGQEHPGPNVLELYQRSIERSQKVISSYPKSKWVDDARYLIGMAYMRREEWDKGYAAFEDLIARHPDSELIPDARLGMGLCLVGRGDWEGSDKVFEALLADQPKFKRRGEVLFHLARSNVKRKEYRRAIVGLSELLAHDVESAIEADARQARGDAYLAVDAPDSALTDFRELVNLQTLPERRLDAELKVGECLERLGRQKEALLHYARLEREMPGPNHLPRTLLARARVLGDLGRHPEALAVYERVTRDFPASNYAAQAQYQIGLTQELHLDNVEAAKAAYAKVSQIAPSSEFANLAAGRRQSLDLFGQYRQELTSGAEEEKKAQAGFLLAELTLFRMRKPQEALVQYQAVERDYPRSKLAPKAAYATAWIQEHELGDSLAAAAVYRRVFDYYPNTEYGVQAGVKAGLLSADSLSIYLGQVLKIRARADSLVALERLRTAADSLGVGVVAAAESLAVAAAESLTVARAESLAAVVAADSLARLERDTLAFRTRRDAVHAGGDSVHAGRHSVQARSDSARADSTGAAADSLESSDPYSGVPPSERPSTPDTLDRRRRESEP